MQKILPTSQSKAPMSPKEETKTFHWPGLGQNQGFASTIKGREEEIIQTQQCKVGVTVSACDNNSQVVGVGRSGVQGRPMLHSEFKVILCSEFKVILYYKMSSKPSSAT